MVLKDGWGTLPPGLAHCPCSGTCALTIHSTVPHLLRTGVMESLGGATSVCVVTSAEPGGCAGWVFPFGFGLRPCPGAPEAILISVSTLFLGSADRCDELGAVDGASLRRWGPRAASPAPGLGGQAPRLGQREAGLPVLPPRGHKGAPGPGFSPFRWSRKDSQQPQHTELFWKCWPSSCSCH